MWCSYPEINDIGLTPAVRFQGGEREVGFSVRVGGGLSADPHLGVRLNAFVQQDQAAAVVRKITELFRDQQGLRESRDRARMKHLFLREGWTAETFLAELNRRLGYQLDPAVEEKLPDDIYRDHVAAKIRDGAAIACGSASSTRTANALSPRRAGMKMSAWAPRSSSRRQTSGRAASAYWAGVDR